jgi:transcriptional regulator GlxA family with amidase domain
VPVATPAPVGKSIVIPVWEGLDLLDMVGVLEMASWAGLAAEIVSVKGGDVASRTGFTFKTKSFDEAPGPYSAIWVPGGDTKALAALMKDRDGPFLAYVKAQAVQAEWVCSVCNGAGLLAAAGLLDGFEATTHWAFVPCLIKMFPKVKVADGHPRFIVSGNRLTGGGVSSGLDEALKLIELLIDVDAARGAQRITQYYPDPPVKSLIPNIVDCDLGGD